ncbi:uncharacterized protein LOC134541822 [Bacillus rossius redtenbacheri]|uniref:uncharacterized protein LOC134541822 n=1 Tax=Bacillus rossius redtenbacheri TaxID=93214 RepID=UPI002FDD32D5
MERHTLADAQNMFTPICFESDAPFEMQLPANMPGRRSCRSKKKKMGARSKMSELYFARRQALRQALVQAIMLAGDEEEIKASDIHFDHTRNISRYYFYVQRGMDLTLTAPLESSRVDGMLARVPARLRRRRAAEEDLVREARDEHAYAMRRAVADFAGTLLGTGSGALLVAAV